MIEQPVRPSLVTAKAIQLKILTVTLLLLLGFIGLAQAAVLTVNVNESQTIPIAAVTKMAIANPEVADVVVISPQDILLIGKKMGTTSLYVWDARGNKYFYTVAVANLDTGSAYAIETAIGYAGVKVHVIGDTVLLEGKVSDQTEKIRAENIAKAYSGKVSDLLELTKPKNIDIEVRILEISESNAKDLGLDYGVASTTSGSSTITIGTSGSFTLGQTVTNSEVSGRWGGLGTYSPIGATLSALITNGKARVLSAPHIVTLSGEKAKIQIGGQIPVPSSNKDGVVTVEWKNYGILLSIEPVVNSQNRIRSVVQAEVSSIDSSNEVSTGNGITIPAIKTRNAESVVDMPSGQTMIIGGLISSDDAKSISKIPLLSDIPIIGELFKHRTTSKARSELIILVTPRVVIDTDLAVNRINMSGDMKQYWEETKNETQDANRVVAPAAPLSIAAKPPLYGKGGR